MKYLLLGLHRLPILSSLLIAFCSFSSLLSPSRVVKNVVHTEFFPNLSQQNLDIFTHQPTSCPQNHTTTTPIVTDMLLKGIGWTQKGDKKRDYADRILISRNSSNLSPNFVVLGGGNAPDSNEIALEKNILYFQRTLKELGHNSENASIFFANGNDGQPSIRYIDQKGKQQFKVPSIPGLTGKSNFENLQTWMQNQTQANQKKPIFMYFTGHGIANNRDLNNSSLTLWDNDLMSVQKFSQMLDNLPNQNPIALVMVQCFSGSFANFIYEGGNPQRPVALQSRCGFFATIKTLPSVGCTPLVNEADYRDYSSSFFAGLSGRNRVGKKVASADYNLDGKVSYAEAHAFAKVDAYTMDLPISTSEAWLQEQVSNQRAEVIFKQSINTVRKTARPGQKYVIDQIIKMFKLNPNQSYQANLDALPVSQIQKIEQKAYIGRLGMELLNVGMEKLIRTSADKSKLGVLEKLLKCENSFWN